MLITNLPLPPSANEMYETNVHKKWKVNKTGSKYLATKTSRRASDSLKHFQYQCLSFKNLNYQAIAQIRNQILEWISQGYVIRMDAWCAFEHSRVWTKDGQPKQIDADNRRKPLQDGLASILDIDDKWIFSGIMEKVTCASKDLECSVVNISPMKAQTLMELKRNMAVS